MQSEIFCSNYLMFFVLLGKTVLLAAFVSSRSIEAVTVLRTKKGKLEDVLSVDYMSPEENVYESNSDEDNEVQGRMAKLVVKRFEWCSDELTKELKSLDRKANRARSERGKRMTVKREEGGFVANSLHCHPKSAPSWALKC